MRDLKAPPASIQRELMWCAPLAAITIIGFACAQWMTIGTDLSAIDIVLQYSRATALLGVLALSACAAIVVTVLAVRREPSPLSAMGRIAGGQMRSVELVTASVFGVACTTVLMGSFGAMKMLLPLHREFTWDDTFAWMDRVLFLGWHPWQVTHLVLPGASATRAIDTMYTLWVPLLFLGVIVAACAKPATRARFLLSFGAAWLVLGVAGAYLFASAGPCYASLTGAAAGAEYQPLMSRLHMIGLESEPLNAVVWQSTLWNAHITGTYAYAMGISAMPSMHNAITMLYALSLWNARPLFRYGSRLFALLVFIASVHLGWHYAVDGLAAWLGMAAIWWATGLYLRKVGYIAAPARGEPGATVSGSGGTAVIA